MARGDFAQGRAPILLIGGKNRIYAPAFVVSLPLHRHSPIFYEPASSPFESLDTATGREQPCARNRRARSPPTSDDEANGVWKTTSHSTAPFEIQLRSAPIGP